MNVFANGIGMSVGVVCLIALLVYLVILKYRENEPVRDAFLALVPLDVMRRRARNYSLGAGIALILYGLLKVGMHSAAVAVNGIQGFGTVPGIFSANAQGEWLLFGSTLLLGTTLFAAGVFTLRSHTLALWLAAPAIALDLIVSTAIGLGRFGRASDGFILVMAAMLIPALVGAAVTVALQQNMLWNQKQLSDERDRG
jgi:hypothetical protein